MSKRLQDDDEMSEVREHLGRQDKTLSEILHVLKGSVAMGTDGLIQKFNAAERALDQMCSDVAHLQKFKKTLQESKVIDEVYELRRQLKQIEHDKGRFFTGGFTPLEIFKTVSAVLVFAGAIVGLMLALKDLLEK